MHKIFVERRHFEGVWRVYEIVGVFKSKLVEGNKSELVVTKNERDRHCPRMENCSIG